MKISKMKIKKANQLVRDGLYSEALLLFQELHEATELDVYKRTIQFLKLKIEKSDTDNKVVSTKNKVNSILFVTAGLKGPTAGGGIATCFNSMVRTLYEYSDTSVTILYVAHPYYAKENYTKWRNYYQEEFGANLVFMENNKKNYGSTEMQRSYAILNYLIDNEDSYDSVVFHDFMGLAYYSLLYQKYQLGLESLKFMISAHGNHLLSYDFGMKKISTWNEKIVMLMERRVFEIAETITTPSVYYSNWIKERFFKTPIVLPNIIYKGDSVYEPLKINEFTENHKILIFYGRFERLKGIDLFLNSINHLFEEGCYYNIIFAGNPTKIDGQDSIDYIKSKIKSEIPVRYLLNCDSSSLFGFAKENNAICVFPTLGETSSCVVVECILNEVNFIASDIDGIKELINTKNHDQLIFSSGSMDSLVQKIKNYSCKVNRECLAFDMVKNQMNWVNFLTNKFFVNKKKSTKKNFKPLVSIVVPTADRPDLLKETLHSLTSQTYGNIEIIVVDDYSQEFISNKSVCDQFKVKYIKAPDKFYKGRCCNVGAAEAKGDYICFFDDDDLAKPQMIENYMKIFSVDNSADIISGFADCFEHQIYKDSDSINVEYTSLAVGGGLPENLHINFFGKGTFVVRKQFFMNMGGYEVDDDSVPMVDYRFYIKAAINSANIIVIPIALYYYRKNSPNSLFYINKDKKYLQYKAKKSIEKILKERLGEMIGGSIASFVWTTGMPLYE